MNQAAIDFQQLRIKHILFKSKVRSVLYGGSLDAEFFSANGPINNWFNSIGISRYRNVPEMQTLMQTQQELNNTANTLFSLYKKGKIEEAHQGLTTMDTLSEKFSELLSTLGNKVAA